MLVQGKCAPPGNHAGMVTVSVSWTYTILSTLNISAFKCPCWLWHMTLMNFSFLLVFSTRLVIVLDELVAQLALPVELLVVGAPASAGTCFQCVWRIAINCTAVTPRPRAESFSQQILSSYGGEYSHCVMATDCISCDRIFSSCDTCVFETEEKPW